MSSATVTISPSLSPSGPPGPPAATDPPPEGDTGSTRSFTEVLSEQRDGSRDASTRPDDVANRDHSPDGRPTSQRDADGPSAGKAGDSVALPASASPLVPSSAFSPTAPAALPVGTVAGGVATVPIPRVDSGSDADLVQGGPEVVSTTAPDQALSGQPTDTASVLPRPGLPASLPVAALSPPGSVAGSGSLAATPSVDSATTSADAGVATPTPIATAVGSGASSSHGLPARPVAGMVLSPVHNGADEGPPDAPAARPITVEQATRIVQAPMAGRQEDAATSLEAVAAARSAGSVVLPELVTATSRPSAFEPASTSLDLDGLSGSISRPLSEGNGTYTVSVALHPPELGHVQAVMTLDGNDLQVSIAAQTQRGHDALSAAADALKEQLARGGVNVNVTLRDPHSPSDGDDRRRGSTAASPGNGEEDVATGTSPPAAQLSGQIHLVL
jgi:hypothetical protein